MNEGTRGRLSPPKGPGKEATGHRLAHEAGLFWPGGELRRRTLPRAPTRPLLRGQLASQRPETPGFIPEGAGPGEAHVGLLAAI